MAFDADANGRYRRWPAQRHARERWRGILDTYDTCSLYAAAVATLITMWFLIQSHRSVVQAHADIDSSEISIFEFNIVLWPAVLAFHLLDKVMASLSQLEEVGLALFVALIVLPVLGYFLVLSVGWLLIVRAPILLGADFLFPERRPAPATSTARTGAPGAQGAEEPEARGEGRRNRRRGRTTRGESQTLEDEDGEGAGAAGTTEASDAGSGQEDGEARVESAATGDNQAPGQAVEGIREVDDAAATLTTAGEGVEGNGGATLASGGATDASAGGGSTVHEASERGERRLPRASGRVRERAVVVTPREPTEEEVRAEQARRSTFLRVTLWTASVGGLISVAITVPLATTWAEGLAIGLTNAGISLVVAAGTGAVMYLV